MNAPPHSPTILIGVPAFESWDYIGKTLESIKAQTYKNFRVIISLDGGDQRTFAVCQDHARNDPRFEVILQQQRLFWEGNINWLASQLREDYFCYWQHDDHCDPSYLQKLIDHAVGHPVASSIYCDMQFSGTMDRIIRHPSTTGFALQRVLAQVEHFDPAVLRCLIRADAMRAALPVKLVFTWGMALARAGELHRVPEVLYFRHIRPEGLTYTMLQRPPEAMWQASLDWALGLIENAYPLVPPDEGTRLFALAVDKAINGVVYKKWQYDFEAADRPTRLKFVKEFLSAAQTRFGWRPYPELLASGDPIAALTAQRERMGLQDGESLIINAMLGDLTGDIQP